MEAALLRQRITALFIAFNRGMIERIDKGPLPNESALAESAITIQGDVDPSTKHHMETMLCAATNDVRMIEANPNFERFAKDRAILTITSSLNEMFMDLSVGYFDPKAISRARNASSLVDAHRKRWEDFNLSWADDIRATLDGIMARRRGSSDNPPPSPRSY